MNAIKWKCKSCGGYQKKNQRVSSDFCSLLCYEKAKEKECKFCGEKFKCKILSQRYCDKCTSSEDIQNAKARNAYEKNLKNITCKNCGELFSSRSKVILCSKCKESLPNPLVHSYKDITRDVFCVKCKKKAYEEIVKESFRTNKTIQKGLCLSCKNTKKLKVKINKILRRIYYYNKTEYDIVKEKILELFPNADDVNVSDLDVQKIKNIISIEKEKLSQKRLAEKKTKRQLYNEFRYEQEKRERTFEEKILENNINIIEIIKNNNPIKKEWPKRKRASKEKILENNRNLSERMKKNNPMKKEWVVKKMVATFRDRLDKGLIVYQKGNKNKNWKGNRGFNLDCRSRLYKVWILKVMKRDGFSCVMCCKKGNLQVHHVRELRNIIKIVLELNKISDISVVDKNSELYERLINDVIKEHKLSDGITVCATCHDKIDEKYRRYKGENKKNT